MDLDETPSSPARSSRRALWLLVPLLVVGGVALVWKFSRLRELVIRPPAPARFHDPEGVGLDAEGRWYVACEDVSSLSVLDASGERIAVIAAVDSAGPGSLTRGDSLVVLAPLRLLMIGPGDDVAEVQLDLEAQTATTVRRFGGTGSAPGQFEGPEGLDLSADGREIFVTDEDNRRVQVFDREGALVRVWEVPEQPEGICVHQERVYLTFAKVGWIGCYSLEGEEILRFGAWGWGEGKFRVPDAVRVDPGGTLLFVSDQRNHRIQVFDLDGVFQYTIGSFGSGPGELREPEDLTFDAEGNLVVADGGNHRVQVFTPQGEFVRELR